MRTLQDMNFKDQRVLVRVDYNVPLKDGSVDDDRRIQESLPTINFILSQKPKQIILLTHLGRPDGKVVESLRLNSVAKRLSELLKTEVKKLDDCIDVKIPDAKIVLLENLRFHPEEEVNDALFARKLASYGDIYVNEAFSGSHRAHASIVGIPKLLPGCAGFCLQKEIENLTLKNAQKPIVAIMGGSKVSDKIKLIENMTKKVDYILLGGAMIFTFYKAEGFNIGKSKCESDKIELAKKLLKDYGKKLILPIDVLVADSIGETAKTRNVGVEFIRDNDIGVDIGAQTIEKYKEILDSAKTVVWNGPVGIFEIKAFANGTFEIAKHLATLKAKTIVGGGDTASAVEKAGVASKMTHVSTGGGASLELLEGKELPGVAVLENNLKKYMY